MIAAIAFRFPVKGVSLDDGRMWDVDHANSVRCVESRASIWQMFFMVLARSKIHFGYELDVLESGRAVLGINRLQKEITLIDSVAGAVKTTTGQQVARRARWLTSVSFWSSRTAMAAA